VETLIFILQIILKWLFLSFAIMTVATAILLQVNIDPQITRLATNLQASGVGHFLIYFFIICAAIAQVGDVALSWYKSWKGLTT